MRAIIRQLGEIVGLIPTFLRYRAAAYRLAVLQYRAKLLAEGLPESYVNRQGATALAWADFLDALAGKRRRS